MELTRGEVYCIINVIKDLTPTGNVVIVTALCDIRLQDNYFTLIYLCPITSHQPFKISSLANWFMLEMI